MTMRRRVLIELAIIAGLTLGLAHVFNMARPEPFSLLTDYATDRAKRDRAKGISLVSPDQAMAALAAGKATAIDAREPGEFAAGHIPGAKSIPFESVYTGLDAAVGGLSKDSPFILYCSDPGCGKARDLAEQMRALGFSDLSVMLAGYEGWLAAGLAVEGP